MGEESETLELQSCLDLLRAGDATAQDRIIDRSCERVRRLARKMLRGYPALRRWEQTDDVMQNALIRLHRSLDDVQPESVRTFFSLAATQIRRSLIDLARHHFGPAGAGSNHRTGDGAAADDAGGPLLAEPSRDGEPQDLGEWTRFHQAVESLPEQERELFNLLWYEGMTQAEAAVLIGVAERTVRRWWESARCLLYDAMNGEQPE